MSGLLDIFDHLSVFITFQDFNKSKSCMNTENKTTYITEKIIEAIEAFNADLKNYSWKTLYSKNDPNKAFDEF